MPIKDADPCTMAEINQSPSDQRPVKIRSKKFPTHIDMTPMVDLAFLLLTFFILTTTLNQLKVIEIAVPERIPDVDPPPITASHVLTLVLDGHNKVYWRQGMSAAFEQIDYAQIKKLLETKRIEITRMALFIKSTNKSRFQNFVDIMDDVEALKIERYYVVDADPDEEQLIREADRKDSENLSSR